MRNHVHLVVGVPGDPDPSTILRDLKAYASRALTAGFARPASGTWWTQSGSRRVLRDDAVLLAAIAHVRNQHEPLVLWIRDTTDRRGS
jgi:REP element-mobilizing transposase RayT